MSLFNWLQNLKPEIRNIVQEIYNDWTGGKDGLCRKIAWKIIDLIDSKKQPNLKTNLYYEKILPDHAFVVCYNETTREACTIDIPYDLYEWVDSTTYRWYKKTGVVFKINDIKILELDPVEFFGPLQANPKSNQVYIRFGVEEPPYGAKIPSVNFEKRDLQDSVNRVSEASIIKDYNVKSSEGVYRAWIPADEIPNPKFPEDEVEENSYPWEDFDFRSIFPAPKIEVHKNGQTVRIIDGNHRIHYWLENRVDYIPCWVIDNRGKNSVWENEPQKNPDESWRRLETQWKQTADLDAGRNWALYLLRQGLTIAEIELKDIPIPLIWDAFRGHPAGWSYTMINAIGKDIFMRDWKESPAHYHPTIVGRDYGLGTPGIEPFLRIIWEEVNIPEMNAPFPTLIYEDEKSFAPVPAIFMSHIRRGGTSTFSTLSNKVLISSPDHASQAIETVLDDTLHVYNSIDRRNPEQLPTEWKYHEHDEYGEPHSRSRKVNCPQCGLLD